jgi:hypothetical protein
MSGKIGFFRGKSFVKLFSQEIRGIFRGKSLPAENNLQKNGPQFHSGPLLTSISFTQLLTIHFSSTVAIFVGIFVLLQPG